MKNNNMIRISSLIFILCLSIGAYPQYTKSERLLSFEGKDVLSSVQSLHSETSISDAHYKDGESSLKWSFKPHAIIKINKNLSFEKKDSTGKDLYQSLFVIWVYNEKAMKDSITFQFCKDEKVCCYFPMNINFHGWRAAWIIYERDMKGNPEIGMNGIRIIGPNQKGVLYFDQLITSIKADQRQQSPDLQVPFVNAKTNNHWLMIYKNSQRRLNLSTFQITEQQINEMKLIEKRFIQDIYSPSILTNKRIEKLCNQFNSYHIIYNKGVIKGKSLFFTRNSECYERMIPSWNKDMYIQAGSDLRKCFDLMKNIAVAYLDADKTTKWKSEFKRMFLTLYEHITDQGVAYGSCLGTIHHYGYSFRNYYVSCFLMKDVLQEKGYLSGAEKAMNWYAQTKGIFEKPSVNGMDTDTFNTTTDGRLISILMMADNSDKVQYLHAYQSWLNIGIYPAPGLRDSFKSDGAIFHHCNCYPAYAVGGLEGVTKMLYYLSKTSFALDELAHSTVKNALLAMRFYCNKESFPLALSGRHPDGLGKLVPIHYARMALAGSPNKKDSIDKEMAGAYLRLSDNMNPDNTHPEYMPTSEDKDSKIVHLLIEKGYKAEMDPQGNLSIGYGCFSVQRRNNWSAVARGFSRYIWDAEHYLGENLYGRYLSYGSLQIMTADSKQDVSPITSGWQEKGFDWRRIPGSTAIKLPFAQLKAHILNVDVFSGIEEMLYSDEAFAGGLSQMKSNGNFGIKLHEHDKYNGSHKARKSYHFFNNEIVCLGSDIENINSEYPTETTLFQQFVNGDNEKRYWSAPIQGKNYIMDAHSTGYYYPERLNTKIILEKNFPQESHNEETTEAERADWTVCTFNHGFAPKNEHYEYAVLPQTKKETLISLANEPDYSVIQQDKYAHIVKCKNIMSYVLFETPGQLPQEGLVLKTDTACLIMVKQDKDLNMLTVCNPDLALYRGNSDDVYNHEGKRIERSIYSRPWIKNESLVVPVSVTLKGRWQIQESDDVKVINSENDRTIIKVLCREGKSYDIPLIQKI